MTLVRDKGGQPNEYLFSFVIDAAWQLIDLTAWILNFVEKLMKQCVISCVPEIKAGAEVTPSSKPGKAIS